MTAIAKVVPSGSTNGKPIKVVATSSTGTTFHTTGAGTSVFDEVHMYLSNTSTSDVIATVEFGGTTSPDNLLNFTVPAKDTICAIPGLILCNSLAVTVFAATGNVLTMSGFINRIT